ncbi:MAG: Lrp/AsnC family transcriptional regulator [Pseudomonadota bacterium]
MQELDSVDLRILSVLQADAKITNRDLAKRVHLSQSSCLARVRKLEESKIIESYHAKLSLSRICRSVTCLVTVSISGQTKDDVVAFQKHVSQSPVILECYTVSGSFDFLLKVVAPDMESYLKMTDELIQSVSSEINLNTHVVMEEVKSSSQFPLDILI